VKLVKFLWDAYLSMTKLLSLATLLLSVAYNTRLSLKKLKVLTSDDGMGADSTQGDAKTKSEFRDECKQILMYWSIIGFYMIFDFHFEFLVRWLPGWYYLKTAGIIAVTFPKLRIGNVVFEKGIVPFLRQLNEKIEGHGGLVNMVSIILYSTPFLVVDIIFPAKMQFAEFIKKSFRISSTSSHEEDDDDEIDERQRMENNHNHLIDAIDYTVPSPTVSPHRSENDDDSDNDDKDGVDVDQSYATLGTEAEGIFGPVPISSTIHVTSPFNFDDVSETSVYYKPDEEEESPSKKMHLTDTSRRLSSLAFKMDAGNRFRDNYPRSASRRASAAPGSEQHRSGGLGFSALFDMNVHSPPYTSSQRKYRRETLMSSSSSSFSMKTTISSTATQQSRSTGDFDEERVNSHIPSSSSLSALSPLVPQQHQKAAQSSPSLPPKPLVCNFSPKAAAGGENACNSMSIVDLDELPGRVSVSKRRRGSARKSSLPLAER
jgi:hypothetical protein